MKTAASMTALLVAVLAVPAFAQQSSREDFQKFCRAFQGRWVGDVTWVADWPGLGKRGEKVTAYAENTVSQDGNALITKFYGGNGSGTGIVAFDAGTKQIKWMWVSSGGYVGLSTLHKKNGQWIEKGVGSLPDGAKNEYTSTVTITDNGNTHTWTGRGTVGGEEVDRLHDVWRRVSQ